MSFDVSLYDIELLKLTYISGTVEAMQHVGLFTIPLLAGLIKEADATYKGLEIFFISWSGISVLMTALVWFLDFKLSNYLFMSDKQRKEYLIHSVPKGTLYRIGTRVKLKVASVR